MRETWGEYNIEDFLKSLHLEKRLIIRIFFDLIYNSWCAVVQDYKEKKPIQLNLF